MTGNADPAFSTEKARITSAGRLLLGTTDEGTFRLDVNGTARVSGVFRQQTNGGNNYFELVANANGTNPYITALKAGTLEYKMEFGASLSANFIVGSGVLIGDAGGNSVNTKVRGLLATNFVEIQGGTLYLGSTTNNFIQFTQTGTSGRGVIGYATGTSYLQIRTNSAVDFSSGTLSTIFDNSGSVGIGGITSVNASAILQTDSTTKGFLPPRMTTSQKTSIASPVAGLQVYDTTLNQMSYYNGTTWINF
jgi:hypothetical protein